VEVREINEIWKKFDDYVGDTYRMRLRKLEYWYEGKHWDDFDPVYNTKFSILNYDQDIELCCKEIDRLFRKYGYKYIKEFANAEGVDFLYNSNFKSMEKNWHCAGFQVQSVLGIISAKLVSNPNYDQIVNTYNKRIELHSINGTMDQSDINRFYKVKDYLG